MCTVVPSGPVCIVLTQRIDDRTSQRLPINFATRPSTWRPTQVLQHMEPQPVLTAWEDLPLSMQQDVLRQAGNPCSRRVSRAWRAAYDAANVL